MNMMNVMKKKKKNNLFLVFLLYLLISKYNMASHGLLQEKKDKEKKELIKNIFRKRIFPDDYNSDEASAIKRVVYNPIDVSVKKLINDDKIVMLYGTSIFKGFPLAGDIDCMEIIPIQTQAKAIQNIINKLVLKSEENNILYFIGDIKCGIVSKFKSLSKYIGYYRNSKIIDYDYEACKYSFNLSTDFKQSQLILPKKITNDKEFIEYLKCYDLAHELITRRWSVDDIKNGYQKNEDGTDYNLDEACYDSQLTKLDLYFCGQIKILECTNTFMKNEKINLNDFNDSLILNMLIQYYAKDKKMKAVKRLLALSRILEDWDICLKLHDFTQRSLAGKYNSIVNNLKILQYIFENYGSTFQLNKSDERDENLIAFIISTQTSIQKLYEPYKKQYKFIIDGFDSKLLNFLIESDYSKENLFIMYNFINGTIIYFENEIDILTKKFIKENNIELIFKKYMKY
jgi:hypothetical protein